MTSRTRRWLVALGVAVLLGWGGAAVLPASGIADVPAAWSEWLSRNHHAIRSVDPRDTDFSDLQFLKAAIGSKRLVQLGESGHGVAEFDSVKVRLIEFLHREMGFEVIAFESGLYECFRADEDMQSLSALEAMRRCIFGVWHAEETLPLFEYIQGTRSSVRPLVLAGFDTQRSSLGGFSDRPEQLRAAFAVFDRALAEEVYAADRELVAAPNIQGYAQAFGDRVIPQYRRFAAAAAAHAGEIQAAFPLRPGLAVALRTSLESTPQYLDQLRVPSGRDSFNIRDRGMADNVGVLLRELYPDRKILIWAHNAHIERDASVTAPSYAGIRNMGSWLHERHAAELYTIGLFMLRGSAAEQPCRLHDHAFGPRQPRGAVRDHESPARVRGHAGRAE